MVGAEVVAMLLVHLLACTEPPDDGDAPVARGDFAAEATLEDDIPTVAWVRWTTEEAGVSWIEHGPSLQLGYTTVPGEVAGTDHAVLLAGMAPNTTWYWRAVTEVGGERLESKVYTIKTGVAPRDLPRVTPQVHDPALAQAGYAITTSVGNPSWVIAYNKEGQPVWWEAAPEQSVIAQVRLADDGTSVTYNIASLNFSTDVGVIRKVRLDGEVLSETRTVMGHHDFFPLPEGGYAYIMADMREWTDPGTGETYTVVGDAIVEIPEGATEDTERTVIWSTWDHLEVEVDPETDSDFYPQGLDWTHCNSIYLDGDDYILSIRKENAFVKVRRSTGETVWQLGGEGSDFIQLSGRPFHGQHSPEPTEAGFLLFDNGNTELEDAYSEAVEYSVNEATGVYEPIWSYPYGRRITSYLLGDVERLENGNTLVAWGSGGTITEVTPAGELAFQISLSIGSAIGFTHHADAIGGVAP